MKIRYLRRDEIDAEKWDDCVAQSTQQLVYAFSWYLDAIAHHWGGIVAEENGIYQAVMPLPYRKKYGISFVHQPVFCQQLGFFSRKGIQTETLFPAFWKEVNRRFRWVASYCFNEQNEQELVFPEKISRVQRENHVLALENPYADIYQQYATDRKINLNRARNTNWQIATHPDMRTLIQLHREHNEAKATSDYKRLDLTLYDRLVQATDELLKRNLADIRLAYKDEHLEAGGLFVYDQSRIIYLFNAATLKGRKQQARLWMINELIERFAGQKMAFDFESPAIGADSVKAYYQSFGATTRVYSEIAYNRLGWAIKALQRLKQLLAK